MRFFAHCPKCGLGHPVECRECGATDPSDAAVGVLGQFSGACGTEALPTPEEMAKELFTIAVRNQSRAGRLDAIAARLVGWAADHRSQAKRVALSLANPEACAGVPAESPPVDPGEADPPKTYPGPLGDFRSALKDLNEKVAGLTSVSTYRGSPSGLWLRRLDESIGGVEKRLERLEAQAHDHDGAGRAVILADPLRCDKDAQTIPQDDLAKPRGADKPSPSELAAAPASPFSEDTDVPPRHADAKETLEAAAKRSPVHPFTGIAERCEKDTHGLRVVDIVARIEAACKAAAKMVLGDINPSDACANLRQDRDRLQAEVDKAEAKIQELNADRAAKTIGSETKSITIKKLQSDLDAAKADATSLRSQLNVIGAWMLKHGCTVLEGESIGAATIRILEGRTAHAERKEREKGEWVRRHDTVSKKNASLKAEVERLEGDWNAANRAAHKAEKDLAALREPVGEAWIDIVFDGPPDHEAPRFVEVEDADGKSIKVGEWVEREDGYWVLRIARPRVVSERDLFATIQHAYRDYKSGGADAFISIGLISVLSGRIHAMLTEKGGTDDGDE